MNQTLNALASDTFAFIGQMIKIIERKLFTKLVFEI